LLIYLYGQRHDVYGEGIDNVFGECHVYVPEVCKKVLNILRLKMWLIYVQRQSEPLY